MDNTLTDVKIGENQIKKALATLNDYKSCKSNLDSRIIANNEWYRMRIQKEYTKSDGTKVISDDTQSSAWLFNSIANKHADAMDNMPEPNVLPREQSDAETAQILSEILPVALERNDFNKVYSKAWYQKLKEGTACYGVFWDSDKLNGVGDITIRNINVLNIFFESGIDDIQDSANVFHVELFDNDYLSAVYPQLNGKLGAGNVTINTYVYDDTVDTKNKTAVIDWYYKVKNGAKIVLHYCKFCNGICLFASENDPQYADGFYTHGQYPFVFDSLFDNEGTPCGFGYIDVMKGAQREIDILEDSIIKNAQTSAKQRFFVSANGNVNEQEFANTENTFIHVQNSNLGNDSIRPLETPTLATIYRQVLVDKIDELKETSGNRDFSQGGTSSGVTAASAIAALQEAGSKLSRDMIKGSYRSYTKICYLCIELMRQFYDAPRTFRIVYPNGDINYQQFTNKNLKPQMQGTDFGTDLGYRLPIFDIEVKTQKSSPYAKQTQNELALQFYSAGFFSPNNADTALAALNMMQFDGKEDVISTVKQNGTMYDDLLKLAQFIDSVGGTDQTVQAIMQKYGVQVSGSVQSAQSGDNSLETQARERVADATNPQ